MASGTYFKDFNERRLCCTGRLILLVVLLAVASFVLDLTASTNYMEQLLTVFPGHFITNRTFLSFNPLEPNHVVPDDKMACVFPHVDPFDPVIMKFAENNEPPISCQEFPRELTFLEDGWLRINSSEVDMLYGDGGVNCTYQEITFHQENDRESVGEWSDSFSTDIELPKGTEFLRVQCFANVSYVVSRSYYALVPNRIHVEQSTRLLLKKREAEYAPLETLNVIMVGLDSISRNQFIRSMRQTHTYLTESLASYDMKMYTQLGKNTFPNILPLMTGSSMDEVYNWWNESEFSDGFDLLWKEFERAGYRTLFTEDWPATGAFHYVKKGFRSDPVQHLSRPLCLALYQDKAMWSAEKHCVGTQPEINFHLDYVGRFLDTFNETPAYAMMLMSKLTHDDWPASRRVDAHLYHFYQQLSSRGHLNRSLLITYSDHGPRHGGIRTTFNGMVEGRTPYAFLTFPQWFLQKYPDVAQNLKTNTMRLTTHFDTHATLQDLIYFKSPATPPTVRKKHGISLFQEIPKRRKCEDIPIPPEFCVCGHEDMEKLDTATHQSQLVASAVLLAINGKRSVRLCEKLHLAKIIQIARIKFPPATVEETRNTQMLRVNVQTIPGNAVYEATVFLEFDSKKAQDSTDTPVKLKVADTVDRLDLYGDQSFCIDDFEQKPFCYCKNKRN
ncbi:unnamed protein product [Lymnaea stagnalis]|uniref:Uncharacterized protein n=1 Tax=Lymnaea stagnalis TaxID=6523 RepID=A0AAV2HTB4_LYMST